MVWAGDLQGRGQRVLYQAPGGNWSFGGNTHQSHPHGGGACWPSNRHPLWVEGNFWGHSLSGTSCLSCLLAKHASAARERSDLMCCIRARGRWLWHLDPRDKETGRAPCSHAQVPGGDDRWLLGTGMGPLPTFLPCQTPSP